MGYLCTCARADRASVSQERLGRLSSILVCGFRARGLETLWVRVGAGGRRVAVCSLYRPPVQTVARVTADLDELERQLQHVLAQHGGPVVLAGDVNISTATDSDSTAARRLRELLNIYELQQQIRGPTYEPSGSSIDILCTNSGAVRAGSLTCDFSPHRWLRALVRVPEYRPVQCCVTARSWRELDPVEVNRRMRQVDWTPVFTSADPDAQWQYFVARALPILDRLAPAKRVKVYNPTAPPITEMTKDLMTQRRACLRAGDRDRYKTLNRQVKAAIREDTRCDLQRRIQDSGRGDMWRCIRPVIYCSPDER